MTEENMENKETNETKKELHTCECGQKGFLHGLCIAILIFLGAFCAFYVIADWYIKTLFMPFRFPEYKIERMMNQSMKMMDDLSKESRKIKPNSNIIHMEQNDNYYKVIIDLRPFDNNVNNIHVTKNGNLLSIQGRSIKKSKNHEHISEFSQNYMFGNDVKLEDMEKETKGNYYIITIPISNTPKEY